MNKGVPIIDSERCKGCGLCVANCPKKILAIGKDFNSQGIYYNVCIDESQCIACGACALMCPDAAIEINKFVEEGNIEKLAKNKNIKEVKEAI